MLVIFGDVLFFCDDLICCIGWLIVVVVGSECLVFLSFSYVFILLYEMLEELVLIC